jgi:sigma-B regulation protein RsbU (phosphoserine phosphatase)
MARSAGGFAGSWGDHKGANGAIMQILVAEDDRLSQQMLKRTLEKWGHQVVTADDGAQAWDLFRANPDQFQFVISDWMMPEMDGPELVEKIRGDQGERYVYIILLTAKTEDEDLITGMQAGADDFIRKPFNREELRVRLSAAERLINLEARLANQNEAMRRDLEAATAVQMSLLPESAPSIEGWHFAWEYHPCEFVAGDIFNLHRLDESTLGFYVLDVSGHGVPAAMLSVTLNRVLEPVPGHDCITKRWMEAAPHYQIIPPGRVLQELNERFPMESQNNLYHTLIYGLLNIDTGEVRMARGGHPYPLLIRGAQGEVMQTAGSLPIGMASAIEYPETMHLLESGDRLILYSDGLTEARLPGDEMLGAEGLARLLAERHGQPLKQMVREVLEEVRSSALEIDDDLTLLGIERL